MLTINLTKTWHVVALVSSIIAGVAGFISTGLMWADTRYMHREIYVRQYVESQLEFVEYRIKEYIRMEIQGREFTVEERMDYDALRNQKDFLTKERNKLLGLGG